jgi:dehydrogenase/reductase SDR family member 7B
VFEGQCWWITGASSGIGAALARALAAKGAAVILSGRNIAALEEVASDCAETLILPFDATDYAALPELAARAWAWKGRVDGIINNAGISQRSLAVETDFSVYERMIGVDLLGPIAFAQANLPLMVAAGGGQMVAISSVAGIVGSPLRSAYSAAKHGLIGYHDSVRCETAHLGIKVLVVAPGSVKTNVSRNALNGDGSARGVSDDAIEAGLDAAPTAEQILGAVTDGTRELILAVGVERHIAGLRRSDPDALFDMMAKSVQAGYAAKMAEGKAGL